MRRKALQSPISNVVLILAMLISSFASLRPTAVVRADHTPTPASVNLVGSLQSEATNNACGDWSPDCSGSAFTTAGNNVYVFQSAAIPAGDWAYKVAMGSWAENYGSNFQQDGSDIALSLGSGRTVRFYYDHKTHYIADNVRNTIYTVPGSFNSELGCSSDWAPDCLRTFMNDVNSDGIFTFITNAIPVGNYNFKVATNESWNNPNYGAGGGGADIAFNVASPGSTVTFSFNTANNTPDVTVVSPLPSHDNNIFWDGLRHDSRDTLYRTPGGAVPAGTPVTIRFRTFHNDVTAVKLRVYSLNEGGQSLYPMTLAAEDVSCYQEDLANSTCDYWAATLTNAQPDNLWYRFIVTDGTKNAYYADNTAALDGGLGATTNDPVDQSYALMVYQPGFVSPAWARDAVIYQIFPDRFRDGRKDNNAKTGDIRYDDPVLKLNWGVLPEGYCRNYTDGNTNCPWRFDTTPPASSPTKEQPRGRDYYGGDLKGVDQQLDYLKSLGINTIYFNPIFDAGSNHSYDTQDYKKIDPYFGTQKDWDNLVKHANDRGMRIVLDGVFNHMSSDSPFFDRYHHYGTVGACESAASQYRSWFTFHDVAAGTGTCVSSTGVANAATYDGWFGFDSIPVLTKTNADLQAYFLTANDSVSNYWLQNGAGGWRMDVSGDPSFPAGYWEQFRSITKTTKPDVLLISETWQKDSTLLRMLRGDRLDTTMNYRLRDAVIGLLTPGNFDSKGFADSGRIIAPSEFAARIESMREDYPDAAYYSLMNLLDSHDTERLLWTLTPGTETTASKELNAGNLTAGKQNLKLASLIQFTMPGAPTVYYGDEVGINGDDDPDDRRTYPWADLGGSPDKGLFAHYKTLAAVRDQNVSLTDGDIRILLADDATDVVAYGRKINNQAAVIIINRTNENRTGDIPVAGYLHDGTTLQTQYSVGSDGPASVTVANGNISGTIGPKSAWILITVNGTDLTPTAAPQNLRVTDEGNAEVSLAWDAVAGTAAYNVYRSPVIGGGYEMVNTGTDTTFVDSGLRNAQTFFYVVKALDPAGNESAPSNEASALPHLTIGWANLQWPPTLNYMVDATTRTDNVYGQVWIENVTKEAGATPSLRAQVGFGPDESNPAGNAAWMWVDATFNTNVGENDEFKASLQPQVAGTYDYVYRYSTNNGQDWLYADLNGPISTGNLPPNPGSLTVIANSDTTPPAAPANLHFTSASPAGIDLAWDAVSGDPSLYGYEVLRSESDGGPYAAVALVTATNYSDTAVVENATYFYVVRAVDVGFNRSGNSNQVMAVAAVRTVSLTFNVTVPATTDATGRSVYIAGLLDLLDGGLPRWNASGVVLTQVDTTHWTITLTGKEGVQIAYKYTLGDWEHVEKNGACGEISDRQLTLSYGSTGTQTVNDTIGNWRNVAPCGN